MILSSCRIIGFYFRRQLQLSAYQPTGIVSITRLAVSALAGIPARPRGFCLHVSSWIYLHPTPNPIRILVCLFLRLCGETSNGFFMVYDVFCPLMDLTARENWQVKCSTFPVAVVPLFLLVLLKFSTHSVRTGIKLMLLFNLCGNFKGRIWVSWWMTVLPTRCMKMFLTIYSNIVKR